MNVILSDSIGVWSSLNVPIDAHDGKHYSLGQNPLQFSQNRLTTGKTQNCPYTFDSTF